ncbi:hypothetical protein HJG53_03705 [Sphingomonas sp. ID1715]|uniref:hypothetical protein n=1 Tax=Sphingomonas sp. ID1715 TaxID=1656898 RepID=UPI001488E982|nr:hypothetical protein [Sphingomonas sp. ID1715]NNM76013.1 hypothetical protein [Sphingomonas sp. ID1715]
MRNILKTFTLAAAALGAVSAASAAPLPPEARLARMLDGRVAGKPVSCLNQRSISSTEIIDDTAIVYRVGSKLYVNRPRSGADWLHRDDILVTRTIGSQLCSIDTVRLLDRTSMIPAGFVSLGDFVPYTRPKN